MAVTGDDTTKRRYTELVAKLAENGARKACTEAVGGVTKEIKHAGGR